MRPTEGSTRGNIKDWVKKAVRPKSSPPAPKSKSLDSKIPFSLDSIIPPRFKRKRNLPKTIMPKKSQQKFYNFTMISILPRILKSWKERNDRVKYFLEKDGMRRWYIYRIKGAMYKADWIEIIILSIIILYKEEKDAKKTD